MLDIDADAEELQVNYMVESKEGLFLWPGKEDVSWEDMDDEMLVVTDSCTINSKKMRLKGQKKN